MSWKNCTYRRRMQEWTIVTLDAPQIARWIQVSLQVSSRKMLFKRLKIWVLRRHTNTRHKSYEINVSEARLANQAVRSLKETETCHMIFFVVFLITINHKVITWLMISWNTIVSIKTSFRPTSPSCLCRVVVRRVLHTHTLTHTHSTITFWTRAHLPHQRD